MPPVVGAGEFAEESCESDGWRTRLHGVPDRCPTVTAERYSSMLQIHPWEGNIDRDVLARCIDACGQCAGTCTSCADACLSEEMVAELRKCIRLNLDCADICSATGRVLIRQPNGERACSGQPVPHRSTLRDVSTRRTVFLYQC